MVSCIQQESECRFHLAHSARITKSSLAYQLGYLSDTEIAREILEGTYDIPNDVDETTELILDEISRPGMRIQVGDEVIEISKEDFQRYWNAVK